jgi:hypothetical protein
MWGRILSFYLSRAFLGNLSLRHTHVDPENGGDNFLWKFDIHLQGCKQQLAETVMPLAIFRRFPVRICTGSHTILIKVFRRFILSLQAYSGIVSEIGHDCFHPRTVTRDPSIRCCRTRVAKLIEDRSRIWQFLDVLEPQRGGQDCAGVFCHLNEVRDTKHRLRVFENRVLRLFGPKSDEVIGGWRKLHNEELHNLNSSPSIIKMIESRRMRWEEKRNSYRIWWQSQKERDH